MTTFLIIAGLLAAFTLLFADMGWNNVLSASRNDLVFEGRNRAYGAYPMRREHHRVMVLAFTIALGFVGTALTVPRLVSHGPEGPAVPPPTYDTIEVYYPPVDQVKPKHVEQQRTKPDKRDPDELPKEAKDSVEVMPKDTTSSNDPKVGPNGPTAPSDSTGKGDPTGGGGTNVVTPPGPTRYAEKMPRVPGGDEALNRFWNREVDFDPEMLRPARKATVFVEFTIDGNGKVAQARIIQGATSELDRAVMRAVRRMPDWAPGRQGDRPVSVIFVQPVRFTVRN